MAIFALGGIMMYKEKEATLVAEVSQWTHKITEVWNPETPLYVRPRPSGGYLFTASLESGMKFQVGIEGNRVDLCGIWQGDEFCIWDSLIGPCLDKMKQGPQSARRDQMRLLIRRNLYRMGVNTEVTNEEKQAWDQDSQQQK